MPSLWDCSDCPAVREARCCREVRKGKKSHWSHRQIEMCQEWDHLFQLQVRICKPGREMKLKTGVWYIRSGRRYTHMLLHTPVRTSFLPLYPTLPNAHPCCSHPLQTGVGKWALNLLPWPGRLNCSAFTWRLQNTHLQEKHANSDWCLICKQLWQKLQRGSANLFVWEEVILPIRLYASPATFLIGLKVR